MGFLVRVSKILAGLAIGFAGYFLMAAVGWPEPLQSMQLERSVLGGLVMLAGLACVWSGVKPRPQRKPPARPVAFESEPAAAGVAEAEPPMVAELAAGALALALATITPKSEPEPEAEAEAEAVSETPSAHSPIAGLLANGDTLFAEGRFDEALDPYAEAVDLARKAHAANPQDPDATGALAKALKANADVYDEQGRMDTAIDLYEEALKLRRELAQSGGAGEQRDLSILLERLGDCREARGHRSRALDLYRESLGIAEGLVKADPNNSLYAEDLAVTRRRIDELESETAPA